MHLNDLSNLDVVCDVVDAGGREEDMKSMVRSEALGVIVGA